MTSEQQICMSYFQARGFFVNQSIYYDRSTSDIDLLVVDLVKQTIYDVEVKLYETKAMYQSKFDGIVSNLLAFKRDMKIKSFLSDEMLKQFMMKKWLITTEFALNDHNWIDLFYDRGIEVHFIYDLIKELRDVSKQQVKVEHDVVMHLLKII